METILKHDYMIIIESLKEEERHTGKELYDDLNKTLGQNFYFEYKEVESATSFKSLLSYIANRNDYTQPLIHIEAHGSYESSPYVYFANNDFLTASEMEDYFIKINLKSKFNLVVSFATCFGYNQVAAFADSVKDNKPFPFFAMNGLKKEINPSSLLDLYILFYHFYFGDSVRCEQGYVNANEIKNRISSNFPDFDFLDVFKLLCLTTRHLIAKQTSGTEREQRAKTIQNTIITNSGTFVPTSSISENITINKAMARSFEKTVATVFAFDIIPENRERFSSISFEDILLASFNDCTIKQHK